MVLATQRPVGPASRRAQASAPLLVPMPVAVRVAHAPKPSARSASRLQPCKAVDMAAAIVLGFLPWSGCSQGGFYSTGVQGSHGEGCQAIYQPAAAAEARFAAAQRKAWQAAAPSMADNQAAAPASPAQAAAAAAAAPLGASQSTVLANITLPGLANSSSSRENAASAGSSSDSSSGTSSSNESATTSSSLDESVTASRQQATAAEHLQQVPESVKDLVREILRADNAARTKQLVDDAWQTLE